MTNIEYTLGDGDVSLTKLINFIALVVLPKDDKKAARDKIRLKIRYARDKTGGLEGVLAVGAPMGGDVMVNAGDFFYWAAHIKWPELKNIEGLPITHKVFSANAVMGTKSKVNVKASATRIPGERSEFEGVFLKSEAENAKLKSELEELKIKHKEIVDEKLSIGDSFLYKKKPS